MSQVTLQKRLIRERIEEVYSDFTDTERSIAEYLSQHFRELSHANASQIARELELSSSTVVRFAQKLGFSGYPDLQKALLLEIQHLHALPNLAPEVSHYLSQYIDSEMRNIAALLTQEEALSSSADILAASERVWIAGDRISGHVAGFTQHFLRMVRPGVQRLNILPGDAPDALLDFKPPDALLVISMSRYSRLSLRLSEAAAEIVPIVLLSDEHVSPLTPYATTTLRFATESVTTLRSLSAAFSTVQALVIEVARRTATSNDRLKQAEALWDKFETFY